MTNNNAQPVLIPTMDDIHLMLNQNPLAAAQLRAIILERLYLEKVKEVEGQGVALKDKE